MSDTYEFNKAKSEQTMDHETCYASKQWNYINDSNNGAYALNNTLVQFDGSSLYNSGSYIDCSQMYVSIPLVRVAAYASNATGTVIAPSAQSLSTASTGAAQSCGVGNEFLTSYKWGYQNLVQSMEIVSNGKTVVQNTPNINIYNNFKLLSQMTPADVASYGSTLGMAELDSSNSIHYYGLSSSGPSSGNGICNNNIFPVLNNVSTLNAGYSNDGDLPFIGACSGVSIYNKGLLQRSLSSVWGIGNITASATLPSIYGTSASLSLFSETNIRNENKNYYAGVLATYYLTWYDTAIIRLCDVSDFFAKMPLVKNFNIMIRMYLNTGVCGINFNAFTAGTALMNMLGSNTTFSNTCPFTINNIANLGGTGVPVPAATTNCVAGLFVQKAITTNILGVNLGASNASHVLSSCRLYFPMVTLKPEHAISYASQNRAKQILFRNVLYQNLQNISAGSSFSQLVQSGVTKITGVLLVPYMSASTHGLLTGTNTVPFSPLVSPFDTAPLTTPMSITQLQVQIGGVNQLMNTYSYTYENFIQQISLYEKITGSDLGLSCGLFTQSKWEQGLRYYWVDCSRYPNSTALEPRNVLTSFVNNSLQTIDVTCFVEYLTSVTLDVETGIVS